jgi:hypothetical protein
VITKRETTYLQKYIWIIVLLITVGCNLQKNRTTSDSTKISTEEVSYTSLDFAKSDKTIKDTSLFYLINTSCAITILPDTNWINKQQQSMSEDTWNTIVDDNQFYESLAIEKLKAKGIKVTYIDYDKRYIKFKKSNNQYFVIDRNKTPEFWGFILFNGIDNPVFWKGDDISKTIKEVYKK